MCTKNELVNFYHSHAYTHKYCLGFTENGNVKALLVDIDSEKKLDYITKADRSSAKNGGKMSLRYAMNCNKWQELQALTGTKAVTICKVEELDNLNKTTKYNKGQIFEQLTANYFNAQLDEKMNTSFKDGGDWYLNGEGYQVKYIKATFTTETTMESWQA